MLPYRALLSGFYEREKLNLIFITKALYTEDWTPYDKSNAKTILKKPLNGKATGTELFQKTLRKETDMAFVGEAAFVKSCALGEPVVGIAMLGADAAGQGGHAIVIKKGIKIKSPRDLEKITWGSRRSSGGDDIFLKEFLLKEGADLSKIKFVLGIDDDKMSDYMKTGKIQGAYYHLMLILMDDPKNMVYTYRKLDWVDPSLSQAVAVVTREYLSNPENRDTIKRFIRAYMKRTAYEHSLPKEKRRLGPNYEKDKPGYKMNYKEMEVEYLGMNLPQFPKIPTIRKSLSEPAVDMLYRHKFIDKKIDLSTCYDNSLVAEIAAEMYTGEALPD